jgi:type II secretory pathway predicted ATPase ExeA
VRFHISPLERDEVERYIHHRLTVAGSKGDILFPGDSIERIYSFSGGIPRLINMICDKSLLAAYVMETRNITLPIVEKSIDELEGVIKV